MLADGTESDEDDNNVLHSPVSEVGTDDESTPDAFIETDAEEAAESETESNCSEELVCAHEYNYLHEIVAMHAIIIIKLQADVENCTSPGGNDATWFGKKYVGDNVDYNVKPSFQRQERHTGQSLHHFHGYAARDRVNLSMCSDTQPSLVQPDPGMLLPSDSDLSALKKELTTLTSRYVCEVITILFTILVHTIAYLRTIWMTSRGRLRAFPITFQVRIQERWHRSLRW